MFQTETPFLQSKKKSSIPPFNKWIPPPLEQWKTPWLFRVYRGLIILPSYILDYNKPWSLVKGRFFSWITSFSRRLRGKYPPAQTFVLGCGVAGLSAIGTSKAMGSVVRAWDVRDVSDQAGGYGLGVGHARYGGMVQYFFLGWFNGFGVLLYFFLMLGKYSRIRNL